jgi:hypothetical protein
VLGRLHESYVDGWNALRARSPGEPGWREPTPYEEASGVVALVAFASLLLGFVVVWFAVLAVVLAIGVLPVLGILGHRDKLKRGLYTPKERNVARQSTFVWILVGVVAVVAAIVLW